MRNADKDRELFTMALKNRVEFLTPYGDIVLHWLERAVSAEQRVAELERKLNDAADQIKYMVDRYPTELWTWGETESWEKQAYDEIKALKGVTES